MERKGKKPTEIEIIDSDDYKKTSPEKNLMSEEFLSYLLSEEKKIDVKIERALSELRQSYILLLIVEPKDYVGVVSGLFRRFVKKDRLPGVFVTSNKGYDKIIEELQEVRIDAKDVRFIDMISMMTGAKSTRGKNVDYLESATDLMELVLLVEKRVKPMGNAPNFLIVDSISTLLVYNEPKQVEKLVHALIGKVNKLKTRVVLIMVKSGEQAGTMQTIAQFCDKVAEIGND